MSRPAIVHVDIAALQYNLNRVRTLAPNSKILAMVKSNAYGHGLNGVAQALSSVNAFGVASLEEAAVIRELGLNNRIVLLAGFFVEEELKIIVELNCDIVVHCEEQIRILQRVHLSKPITVWMKINTGMNRLGFLPRQVKIVYQQLSSCLNVSTINLMTHFSDADDLTSHKTKQQILLFEQATENLKGERSLANSSALLTYPEIHADWVRPGMMLYGALSMEKHIASEYDLKPVMTLASKIIAIQSCQKGDTVGYGSLFQCPVKMNVGIVAIGYGDGYPRCAKMGTPVLIHNMICPLIGRVSMDMLTIDLRSCCQAAIGDDVILWGKGLPVEKIADCANTIADELLTGVARRVKKIIS